MNDLILGIESSCDDTAVALVDENGNVISSFTASQVDIHSEFGGIYPEFAARAHINSILPTVDSVLRKGKVKVSDIKAIGVTRGPGLIGSLLVGINTATALGLGWNKPVVGINHLRGHLRSADLEEKRVEYPAVVLLVSGGHTILAFVKNEKEIEIIGTTRDDSVGEAYDKVARMLDLGYPGGPVVDKMATTGKDLIPFPRPMIDVGYEFSFSGLKSAVSRYLQHTSSFDTANVACSFVSSVMDILIHKSSKALKKYKPKSFVIVGGVAASPQLRESAKELTDELGISLCLPPLKWSTDNGAMIALAAWDYIKYGVIKEPIPQLELSISDF